jgi:S1-C subfamily serine protease
LGSSRPVSPVGLDQADDLQVGDFVLAISNPLDGEQSTTFGIVSGLHRSGPGTDNSDLIATDALIAQRNSGGPLVNLRAELVGINIIRLGSGLAFSVPVVAVRKLLAAVRLDG